jgi:hypothetical protein
MLLASCKSIAELARDEGLDHNRIRKLLALTHLGPSILKRALTGLLPPSLTLNDLLAAAQYLDWAKQWHALDLEERPIGQRTPA